MTGKTDTQAKAANARNSTESSNGFGSLRFSDSNYQETGIMLTFKEYIYQRPSQGSIASARPTGTEIALPVPYNLRTAYNTDWTMPGGGAFQEYTSNAGGALLNNILNTNKDEGMGAFSALDVKSENVKNEAFKALSAVGTDMLAGNRLFQNAGMGAGVARNPFIAAAFEGVQFRVFSFDYKLYPKSRAESESIKRIIDAFKYGMHPSYRAFGGLKNALFNYPNIFLPAFTKPRYLFTFGYCIIRNLTTDYHSEGVPYYFDESGNKIPAFITLSFEMQEIEVITKDNLNDPNGGGSNR